MHPEIDTKWILATKIRTSLFFVRLRKQKQTKSHTNRHTYMFRFSPLSVCLDSIIVSGWWLYIVLYYCMVYTFVSNKKKHYIDPCRHKKTTNFIAVCWNPTKLTYANINIIRNSFKLFDLPALFYLFGSAVCIFSCRLSFARAHQSVLY